MAWYTRATSKIIVYEKYYREHHSFSAEIEWCFLCNRKLLVCSVRPTRIDVGDSCKVRYGANLFYCIYERI